MFNPFRMFCFAPDGVPDGAPAADAENEQEQHDNQQPETTEQTGDAAAKAAQTAAPAGKEQPGIMHFVQRKILILLIKFVQVWMKIKKKN